MTISLPPKGNDAKALDAYFSALRAQAHATPQMTVQVTEGSFWLADNTHQEYIGGTTPTIFAPSIPSTAKWVVVTVTKNGVLNNIDGSAVSGTPTLPDPSEYVDELPIAAIYLTDTTTAITNEMIFDIRPLWSVPVDAISQAQLNDFATIVYVNNQLAAKADITGTPEPTFILNADGSTINYSGIEVNRAILPDVGIRFNEMPTGSPLDPHWEFTNDGSVWQPLGLTSGIYYTKTEANAKFETIVNVDAHIADETLHMTTAQNSFFDGLILGGSPASLQAADVNQLIGITGNVQTLLDAKLDDVAGVANNIAILDGAGELTDSGWTLNDVDGGSPYSTTDLWSANQIATFTTTAFAGKVNLIVGGTINNFASVEAGGQVGDSGVSLASLTAGFVDLTTPQSIGGVKTFTADVIVAGDLTIGGASATLNTTNLTVADTNITLNSGYVGPTSGSDGAGITVDRNVGTDPTATIIWDDATERWKAGLDTAEDVIALEGVTVAQPFYEIAVGKGGSPVGDEIYTLGFGVPTPVAGTTGLQVFVNGIKQVEGAGKAYQVNYTNPAAAVVTFEAGSEPTTGADVEFYGFGYIA